MITSKSNTDEIIEAIERDFPGWDWLMRSNNDPRGDGTGSTEKYFANLMTPDYKPVVVLTALGQVSVGPGTRFTAYGATQQAALLSAYNLAYRAALHLVN